MRFAAGATAGLAVGFAVAAGVRASAGLGLPAMLDLLSPAQLSYAGAIEPGERVRGITAQIQSDAQAAAEKFATWNDPPGAVFLEDAARGSYDRMNKLRGEAVTGVYKSDKSGESYDIVGKIGPQAHRIEFKVTFPMTEQKYEGFLWTHDRDRITGVTQMLDQPFGFQAVRKE